MGGSCAQQKRKWCSTTTIPRQPRLRPLSPPTSCRTAPLNGAASATSTTATTTTSAPKLTARKNCTSIIGKTEAMPHLVGPLCYGILWSIHVGTGRCTRGCVSRGVTQTKNQTKKGTTTDEYMYT